MVDRILSIEKIYTAISLTKKVEDTAIITFMLSTGIKSDKLATLTIKDLLDACGKDSDDENSLKKLLDENPFEIRPYWIIDYSSKFKLVINSPESLFYLFLYLKNRYNDINNYDEALFAKDNTGSNYNPRSIRVRLSELNIETNDEDDVKFTQKSIIYKFENACNLFVRDEDIKKLFLGQSTKYNTKDEILEELSNDSFKKKLDMEHNRLIPNLTANYFMHEYLKQYIPSKIDEDNYREKIEDYYNNTYFSHFRDNFNEINLGKNIHFAFDIAEKDLETGKYEETYEYYNMILHKSEAMVCFYKLEHSLGDNAYRNYPFENISPEDPTTKVNLVCECIEKMKIPDKFIIGLDFIKSTVIHVLSHTSYYMGNFDYESFKEVLFEVIHQILE